MSISPSSSEPSARPLLFAALAAAKTYRQGTRDVPALRGVDLEIAVGEMVAIMGPSGSGKSTLLHLLGGLDRPTSGRIIVDGADLGQLSDADLTRLRRRRLGFVFQFFNLLPTLTVRENVALPLLLDGVPRSEAEKRADQALERLGVMPRAGHFPDELSGGEMQRTAIARAILPRPLALLCDEPTGNLDSGNALQVLQLLRGLADDDGVTVIMVTHDEAAARRGDRLVRLRDGRLETDTSASLIPSV